MKSWFPKISIMLLLVPVLTVQFSSRLTRENAGPFTFERSHALAQTIGETPLSEIPQIGLITGFGCCGKSQECLPGPRVARWGPFGLKDGLTAKSGEKLRITCEDADVPFFLLLYTPAGGVESRVGICPFEGGCNTARFFFIPDGVAGVDSQPGSFSGTFWRSKDFGNNDDETFNSWTNTADPNEKLLDWALLNFNTAGQNLEKTSLKWEYLFGPPVFSCPASTRAEGALVSQTGVDPPLGPQSEEFFRDVEQGLQVQPPGGEMREDTAAACDLNGDGFCNDGDFNVFAQHQGSCLGSPMYNPVADLDGNGCINAVDRYYLYEQDSDRDGIPDLQARGEIRGDPSIGDSQ